MSAIKIADYDVLEGPFVGGFGEVYKVFDRNWGDEFALKTLRGPFVPSSRRTQQFRHEVEVWLTLPTDPNVVRAIKAFELEGRPYVVMEWVGGGNLGSSMHSLDGVQALAVLRQFCSGMMHVHAHGLVHGDIKPSNVLIWGTLSPQISDFGFSRLHTDQSPDVIGGTRKYMAPELISGELCTTLSDVFAAGVMFREVMGHLENTDFGVSATRSLTRDMTCSAPAQRPQSFVEIYDRLQAIIKSPPYWPFIVLRNEDRRTFEEKTLAEAIPEKHLMNQVRSELTAGHRISAKEKLEKIIGIDPNHLEALTTLGDLAAEGGERDLALQYLRNARQANSGNSALLFNLALSYARLQCAVDANEILDKLSCSEELSARVFQLRGEIAYGTGELSDSIDFYREAVAAGGGPACKLSLAKVLGEAGMLQEAVEICRSIDPGDQQVGIKAQVTLARLYISHRDYDAGIQTLRSCLKEDLGTEVVAYIHSELGYAYMQQQLYEPAIAHFKVSLTLNPKDEISLKNLHYCQFLINR